MGEGVKRQLLLLVGGWAIARSPGRRVGEQPAGEHPHTEGRKHAPERRGPLEAVRHVLVGVVHDPQAVLVMLSRRVVVDRDGRRRLLPPPMVP